MANSVLARAARLLRRAVARGSRAEPRRMTLLVAADADAALLACAAALKRLGARILRYDGDTATLEAQRGVGDASTRVSVHAIAEGEGTSRLRVESAAAQSRALLRDLRRELSGKGTRR